MRVYRLLAGTIDCSDIFLPKKFEITIQSGFLRSLEKSTPILDRIIDNAVFSSLQGRFNYFVILIL